MKLIQFQLIFAFMILINRINADCGCLQCSKHLHVVSPHDHPIKIIYRGHSTACAPPLPYQVQVPIIIQDTPKTRTHDYKIEAFNLRRPHQECCHEYGYRVQAPLFYAKPQPKFITGLIAIPDRVVLPQPETCCIPKEEYTHHHFHSQPTEPAILPLCQAECMKPQRKLSKPIIEHFVYDHPKFHERYENNPNKRNKRELFNSINYFMDFLPKFIKLPIERTFQHVFYPKHMKPKRNRNRVKKVEEPIKKSPQPPIKSVLLYKLRKLNSGNNYDEDNDNLYDLRKHKRWKRRIDGDESTELILPFFKVTDLDEDETDGYIEDSDNEFEESDGIDYESNEIEPDDEIVSNQRLATTLLQPLKFDQLIPRNPLFYLINTPIRFLHHFHNFGQQFNPLIKSVPLILLKSKSYFRNFRRKIKNNFFNIASHLIGDFTKPSTDFDRPIIHRGRYRRDLNREDLNRKDLSRRDLNRKDLSQRDKRYIMKMVDEDEVEEFLNEKLGHLVRKKPVKTEESRKTRKFKIENLSSKLIFDNNGRPFMEINGVKRPILLNRDRSIEDSKAVDDKHGNPGKSGGNNERNDAETEDITEKINNLINKAKNEDELVSNYDNTMSKQIIKDRIFEILKEIENLITINYDDYSIIFNDLNKLEKFKELIINDWTNYLNNNNQNDFVTIKIKILDNFKEIQLIKDKLLVNISTILKNNNNFMTKKLIKILVRLQKLQCLIQQIVDDFNNQINFKQFNNNQNIINSYVNYLMQLNFVDNNKGNFEENFKNERNLYLNNLLKLLENLNKLLETNCNNDETSHDDTIYKHMKLLWEINNIRKILNNSINDMNEKILRGQKIRKELKILFDLLKQLEFCEEEQMKLFNKSSTSPTNKKNYRESAEITVEKVANTRNDKPPQLSSRIEKIKEKLSKLTSINRQKFGIASLGTKKSINNPIIEDKKPIKLVSNGYTLTAYKVTE